ncbi:hypothetical protein CDD83_11219 [Cordyceps sp. RAO-2017]|nr:hypothetical protein CDD83_11219 [Cordyceps sp. RAO-2017]
MLTAPASNHHHPLPVTRNGQVGQPAPTTAPYDFLPSVSFDDLHASIESASSDFKLTQFPSAAGEGAVLESKGMPDRKLPPQRQLPAAHANGQPRPGNPPVANRTGRSGSILRRPSMSGRHPSNSSIVSSSSGTLDAPSGPPPARSRRQSHYPPISNAHVAPKPPRKSIGPGIVGDADGGKRSSQGRRPSLLGDRGPGPDSARRSVDSFSAPAHDAPRHHAANSRAVKAKSVQPPMRPSQASAFAASSLTPEQNRLSTLAPRSPRVSGRSLPQPSGGKRASMMPGAHHPSHATGLGARTISPTDTRRMKRLSTMPHSQSLNAISSVPPPPPLLSMDIRANSKSPSMIPRRTSATPSSSRTTPDASNRKSYSSGLSVGSAASFNTMRTSSASLQPRLPQSSSASRLPAPKHTPAHNPLPADDDEDVPPVPAIPKAYESPKDSPAETYFLDKRKTSLPAVDSLGGYGNAAGNIPISAYPEPTKAQQQYRADARKSSMPPPASTEEANASQAKRQLQPLRLPPLNIGPLNLPPGGKAAAAQDLAGSGRDLSPPPSRQLPKTPTTPMTASKSSFFSKTKYDETIELPCLRSRSSIHQAYRVTPTPPDADSSSSSIALSETNLKSSLSPFLSSSLPKGGLEHGLLKRSKTGGDYHTLTGNEFDAMHQRKAAGLRSSGTGKTTPKSPSPPDPVSEELRTPSSMNSLRRKLSLSWRRGNSKAGIASSGDNAVEMPTAQLHANPDTMPPPRLPAAASSNSLANPKRLDTSPTMHAGGAFLESRRRKNSAASQTAHFTHDRVKSDNWVIKKENKTDSVTLPVSHSMGLSHKMLKPKPSLCAFSSGAYSAVELDKDDLAAEEEMRKMGSRRKETEIAARALDALRKRATPKERVSPHEAIRIALLNIYERGEIIDFDDIYFCGTQNAHKVVGDVQSDAPNFGYDDERGDYTIVPGDHLAYRYEIIDVLGKGSFGQVVRCIDHKLGVLVAVKIIRNKKRFHQQALVEVNILQRLREWDPKNRHSMVSFTQHFYFRGHLCISTELLDMNLYEFIKAHAFRGFSLRIIRRFTKQILSSLILLKQRKVIHCDLKPENILLRHPLHSEIKVIDFGSSCFENEKVYTYIQSRFYRSPEVILGMTYGMPIDMWSVGCILAELYTGVPIFPGENEQEQLACIMEVFGPPEKHLIEKSTRRKLFFDSVGKPRLTVSSKGRRRRPSSKTLQQVLKCDDEVFVDFLARCLRWDPERRLKPEEAVRHEFISGQKAPAPAARLPTRDPSPVKRNNTVSTPRPLPDPPGATGKGIMAGRTGVSPHKQPPGAARRVSGATAATAASTNRRTSGGSGSISGGFSGLPRAAGRTASGKHDLAAAGASAAMTRRA